MKYSQKYDLILDKNTFPLLSLKKFSWFIHMPLDKLKNIADKTDLFYQPFVKKTNNKERIIDNPIGILKDIQNRINKNILNRISFPNFIIGGIKGKDPSVHPGLHIKKSVVVTMDIKDCFPSITNKMVFDVWYKTLKCSSSVANLATKLTTTKGHLPLGAPTSNYLANLALFPCVTKTVQIAEKFNFEGSQYIDDTAFSGRVLPNDLISLIIKEFSRGGFKVNRSKIFVMRSNVSQRVVKKVVNRKVGVPRLERNRIRAALDELKKMDKNNPGYLKLYKSVKGRIDNLKLFHPDPAKKMLEQLKTAT